MTIFTHIPKAELEYIPYNSLFIYQVGIDTLSKSDKIYSEFIKSNNIYNIQMLDNGKLVIIENIFGGGFIVSQFTCGLLFCIEMSKYLREIENGGNEYKLTIGSGDFHSGWNYDFNLKFEYDRINNNMKVIKDYDFVTTINVRADAFINNYFIFEKYIYKLFNNIYPKLMKDFENSILNNIFDIKNL